MKFERYKCGRNSDAVWVQSSYQLVDAERHDNESQQEVGDGKAGDDAVGHVLKLWLQQQGEQDKAVAGYNPRRDDGQRQQTPLWRQRRPALRVRDAVRFRSAEFWRRVDDDVIRRVHSRHAFDRRQIGYKIRFQQSDLVLVLVLNTDFFVITVASDWTIGYAKINSFWSTSLYFNKTPSDAYRQCAASSATAQVRRFYIT